ncbi:MAG TPA: hypothetical protein VE010_01340 [Thermoanaerobaculia bacterium]|nr:hypothetical protein [Thermoanaerobaculia bacterium]
MGHYLQALVVPLSASERLKGHSAPVHPVRITPALLLLPVTDELYDYLVDSAPAADAYTDVFSKFHPALRAFGASIAGDEPFGYVATDYFGGQGGQAAGAWRNSETLVTPHSAPIGPINEVLRALGVVGTRHCDEFETAGLARHRLMGEWLEEPRFGDAIEAALDGSVRRVRRLAFDQPARSFPAITLDLLGQVIAQVRGIAEAHVVRCSINGEAAEDVLAVGIDDELPPAEVLGQLLPKVRLLLGPDEQLDVLPFRISELPHDVRRNGYVIRFAQPERRWWKIW